MKEVEVKARASLEDVRRKLTKLGARRIRVEVQEDLYFSHPCRDFAESDEALRLRVVGGEVELTYKGPREPGRVKSRVEVTVRLDDLERALAILSYLGFKELATVKKLREVYVLDDVEVCLDRVEGLGEFVEVESRGASSRELVELLEELGAGELVAETYLELVLRRSSTPPSS